MIRTVIRATADVDELAGVVHGWAADKDIALTENTEWSAFAMKQTGMQP